MFQVGKWGPALITSDDLPAAYLDGPFLPLSALFRRLTGDEKGNLP